MVLKQLAIFTGVLVVGVGVFLANVGVERGIIGGMNKGILLGQTAGILSVRETLVPGSPEALVTEEPSPELKAFTWWLDNVLRSLTTLLDSPEKIRSTYTPIDQHEPQHNSGTEADLEPGINASMLAIPSSIDNYVTEADLLLPEGVASLKEAERVMIVLHGGGHVLGTRSQEFGIAGLFVHHLRHKKVAAVNLRQRLLPDFTVDQKVEDIKGVFRWLTDENGFDANQIAIYGCSAGATMSVVTTLSLLADDVTPGPILLSSPVDHNAVLAGDKYPSQVTNVEYQHLPPEFFDLVGGIVKELGPETEEKLSFLHRDFAGFPPTRLVLGATDTLLDHGKALSKKLMDEGIDVSMEIPPGMWHCPLKGTRFVPESRAAVERAAKWLEHYL